MNFVIVKTSIIVSQKKLWVWDFPGGAAIKNLPANAGDMGLSPGPGRSQMVQSN